MLGHDLEIACKTFHEIRLIIDGEIDKNHATQIINCVLDCRRQKVLYSKVLVSL